MNYSRPLYLKNPVLYGNDVKQIQTRLKQIGFYSDLIDGYFGNNTQKAVTSFQQDTGLTIDGSCGPATWNRLFNLCLNSPQLHGTDIKQIQSKLLQLGYNPGSIDSYFGPNTKNAIIAFQKENNITPNGICDITTWNSLFKLTSSKLYKIKKIFIDPGHGGIDSGAISNTLNNSIFKEKDIALNISLMQKRLFDSLGFETIISRSTDIDISLENRVNMANNWGADLFISNHVNSGGGKGIEIWANSTNMNSQNIATKILENICTNTNFNSRGVKTKTLTNGEDYFYVLRETNMPSILIEHGFIDNANDLTLITNNSIQEKLATCTVESIKNLS